MTKRVFTAGHSGLLGQSLTSVLALRGDVELVHPTDKRVELRDEDAAAAAIRDAAPDIVILAAARVGGLGANIADPVGFLEDNIRIELNVIRAAFAAGVERLLFVGSANAYPADATQPILERELGTGRIDVDTGSYGLAKLVGIQLCDAYRRQHGVMYHSVVPSNLYGPGDHFDPATAHVVAATLRRFHDAVEAGADEVVVWGTGNQRRQLLFSDDLAAACSLLLDLDDPPSWVNAGPHGDTSIREIAILAAQIVGFHGEIRFDADRPEGVLRRELDTTLLHGLGWTASVDLETGMRHTWDAFLQRHTNSPPAPKETLA